MYDERGCETRIVTRKYTAGFELFFLETEHFLCEKGIKTYVTRLQ